MKKKGFTLVEMLGVVTVLAVISVIVVPAIINQVRSRKGQTNKAIIDSINASAVLYINKNSQLYNGQINSCIKISKLVDDDFIDSDIYDYQDFGFDLKDAYILTRSYDKEAEITISCTPIYNTYDNGTAIYFNPETSSLCSNPASSTGVKKGCMKWYVFNDKNTSSTINLILDHNTTPLVGASNIVSALDKDISSWFIDVKSTARLITADEIAMITGADEKLKWESSKIYTSSNPNIGTNISDFYLDGAYGTDASWKEMVAKIKGTSKYAWLYDYTNCVSGSSYNGCNVADTHPYSIESYTDAHIEGYWTNTSVTGGTNKTWSIDMNGRLIPKENNEIFKNGIRPVISIPKSIIK